MVKIQDDDFIYYVNKEYYDNLVQQGGHKSILKLKAISNFVIRKHDNELIKCRNSIEHIIDTFCGI